MSFPDVSAPIRAALLAEATVIANLSAYAGSYPVFTRRPVPPDAPERVIMVSPDVSVDDADGIDDQRPRLVRDITIYGLNKNVTEYRVVETLARAVRDLFHRNRHAITVTDWAVVDIVTRGPMPAPVDDDSEVARLVTLTIQLAKKN